MSFIATPQYTGVPDFKIIDIDIVEVAKALEVYLHRGSKLTGVSIDDISVSVLRLPADVSKVTLTELLALGMRLFDALIWLTAGRPTERALAVDPTMKETSIPSMHEIARSLFYVYFFILTQARYPASQSVVDKPNVPNFLRAIMGMDSDQSVYVSRICTFEPQKFDMGWARHVQFVGFGQEALSRFGLGVAGYRLFGPFKLYKAKDDISEELKRAVTFAERVATSPPTWDIHPATRAPSVLTKRGNLNKNLGNLILDVFTSEQISEMVSSKILYATPTREPTARNYFKWSEVDDISGSSQIFPATH